MEQRPYGPERLSVRTGPLAECRFHQTRRVMNPSNDGAGQLISGPQERRIAPLIEATSVARALLSPRSLRSSPYSRPARFCGCYNSCLTFGLIHVRIAANLPHLGDPLGLGQSSVQPLRVRSSEWFLPASCRRGSSFCSIFGSSIASNVYGALSSDHMSRRKLTVGRKME